MENPTFIDDFHYTWFPVKTSIYRGFPVAMFDWRISGATSDVEDEMMSVRCSPGLVWLKDTPTMGHKHWLVGQGHPSEKNMSSSIGMMTFPILMGKYGKIKNGIQTTNQSLYCMFHSFFSANVPRWTKAVTFPTFNAWIMDILTAVDHHARLRVLLLSDRPQPFRVNLSIPTYGKGMVGPQSCTTAMANASSQQLHVHLHHHVDPCG